MGKAASQILDHTGRPFERPATPRGHRRPTRPVRATYDAAQTAPGNRRHWAAADGLSAAAANSPEVRRVLRNRSRYEVANNSYAKGMVLTQANDTVGTGPRLQMLTADADGNARVEAAFAAWSKAVCLADKLRTMRQAKTTDGEAVGLLVTNPKLWTPVKLDVRLIETDQLATPDLFLPTATAADGVVFDRWGNPVEYHVLKDHPGGPSWAGTQAYDRVPAASAVHWFRRDRPGQVRGVPEILPALPLFAQLRRYTLAVVAAAETAADFAAFLKTDAPADGTAADGEPFEELEVTPGMMTTLPGGWDVSQLRPEQPTTTYDMFTRRVLCEIARCLNMPYNVAAGDSSSYNYASGRLDHQTYDASIRVERSTLEDAVLEPVFLAFCDEAALVPGLLPDGLGPFALWPRQWMWPGREHVDPVKEADAQAVRLASHTTTLADEYARRGLDWEAQLRQRAKERALLRELGLDDATAARMRRTGDDEG